MIGGKEGALTIPKSSLWEAELERGHHGPIFSVGGVIIGGIASLRGMLDVGGFLWAVFSVGGAQIFSVCGAIPRGGIARFEVCLMYAVFCIRFFLYAVPKSFL
jgi:hypothetical protein